MKKILAVMLMLAVASVAMGQDTLAGYDMYGLAGDEASRSGYSDSTDITVNDMVRGSGLAGNAGGNSFNSRGWDKGDGDDADDYVTFSFDVDAGKAVDLDELWIGTRSSNTGPGQIIIEINDAVYTTYSQPAGYYNNVFDLSGYTGLTGTVTFKFKAGTDVQADGSGTISGSGTWRITDHYDSGTFTDVKVTGSVVPEPATMSLLAIGGLAAVIRRRRK